MQCLLPHFTHLLAPTSAEVNLTSPQQACLFFLSRASITHFQIGVHTSLVTTAPTSPCHLDVPGLGGTSFPPPTSLLPFTENHRKKSCTLHLCLPTPNPSPRPSYFHTLLWSPLLTSSLLTINQMSSHHLPEIPAHQEFFFL